MHLRFKNRIKFTEISELVQTIDSCGQSRVRNSIVVRGHEVAFYRDRDPNCRNSANLGSKYIYVDIKKSLPVIAHTLIWPV